MPVKNIYRIERWEHHVKMESKEFTNKKKAQHWLNHESWWWLSYDYGECMIYIFKNDKYVNWIREDKGWKVKEY